MLFCTRQNNFFYVIIRKYCKGQGGKKVAKVRGDLRQHHKEPLMMSCDGLDWPSHPPAKPNYIMGRLRAPMTQASGTLTTKEMLDKR